MRTTTNTPIAMPRIVSAARTLFARSASIAIHTPSARLPTLSRNRMRLLLPQRGDRIEASGARRGIDARDDADAGTHENADDHRPERHGRRQRRYGSDQLGQPEARRDAHRCTEDGERRRLGEELREDVAAPGA